MISRKFFHADVEQDALVIEIRKPVGSLSDLDVMAELDLVINELRKSGLRNVVVDFCQTAYFGSSLLEALRLIWNQVHDDSGRMVLCNLSPIGLEILEVAKFNHLWPITKDRATALQTLQDRP